MTTDTVISENLEAPTFANESHAISWAADQKKFMEYGGQTTGTANAEQLKRYLTHVIEEVKEIVDAYEQQDLLKLVDGLVDSIVVSIGALHSIGIDPDSAWDAVFAANMRKFPDGKPFYRKDGQIGKPPNWRGPEAALSRLLVDVKIF